MGRQNKGFDKRISESGITSIDGKTVIVGADTNTKYVGDYYVAFEPENKRFVPIYPITDEAWEVYGHTMLE